MSSKGSKEGRRQEDLARQAEERQDLINQYLAQLVPGSEEYTQFVTETGPLVRLQGGDAPEDIRQMGQRLVSAQQARIAAGGAATPLEERTQKAFAGLRGKAAFSPEEQAVMDAVRGTLPANATGTGAIFGDLVTRAQRPDDFFRSTMDPQMQIVEEAVKARAASRGITGSGLELESLGRAGVDVAIKEAAAREDFRQRQLDNAMNLFNVSQGLRGREIGVEEAMLNLQSGRESRLTDILNANTFARGSDTANLLARQTGRAEVLRDAAEASEAGRNALIGKGLGTALGAGAGFFVGGPAGASLGASLGGSIAGGGDVGSIIAAQRTGAGTTDGPLDLSTALSRQANPKTASGANARLIDELLRSYS